MVFSSTPNKMVNGQNGLIRFDANGHYETVSDQEIKALKSAQDVVEVKKQPQKQPSED
jgi:hypothetical protein